MKIDEQLQSGEMKKSTSAQKISLSTFDFSPRRERGRAVSSFECSCGWRGKVKHLNAEKRQRRLRVATEQPSTATTSLSAEGDMDALTFNSKRWKATEFSELNDQVRRLKGYIKTIKAELNNAEEEIRKNQRTIFNLEEEVKNVYDALKSRRTHFDEVCSLFWTKRCLFQWQRQPQGSGGTNKKFRPRPIYSPKRTFIKKNANFTCRNAYY
ncbi:uncharacterized protein LOC135689027 [Rhopilema esculentum]|uniref:uncharacterized protein LOC135689027 n=1 Tax=Rhopilema esculentum TaxID=499914 RepID=UPI0031D4EE2A